MVYQVIIQREPEVITYNTFEEAEAKMKELYEKYGRDTHKYFMIKKPKHSAFSIYDPLSETRYDCDENGNLGVESWY